MTARFRNALRLWLRHWPYVVVCLVFLVSRVIYRVGYGIRFDPSPVTFFVQYIDPWFLRTDFLRSIMYLHHQAPLQNVLIGIPLHLLDDDHAYMVLDGLYVAIGLATAIGLVRAMRSMGVRSGWALLTTSLYTLSPTTVLYENWLFYHLPVACLFIWALVALLAFYRTGTFRSAVTFFSLIATAALFRSTLSVVLLVALLGLLLLRPPLLANGTRWARRLVLKAAIVPLLVLTLFSLKPMFLLGYGYGEAMFWGNLSTKVWDRLPTPEQKRLLDEGLVSPAVREFCLADLNYFSKLRMSHPPTGVPLLDLERAPNGRWNAHALEYLLITRHYYKRDALYLLTHYPGAYLRDVGRGLSLYFAPCTNDMSLPRTQNYRQLASLIQSIDNHLGVGEDNRLLVLALVLPVLLLFGGYRVARSNAWSLSQRRTSAATGYMLIMILYVATATTAISYGDFSRYRYDVDPLYLVLLGLLLSDLQNLVIATARRVRATLGLCVETVSKMRRVSASQLRR